MTVINACGIRPDRFLDESSLKIGSYPPGIDVKIESLNVCGELTQPTFFIITAWNFKAEIIAKLNHIGVPQGSIFYSYFPKMEQM